MTMTATQKVVLGMIALILTFGVVLILLGKDRFTNNVPDVIEIATASAAPAAASTPTPSPTPLVLPAKDAAYQIVYSDAERTLWLAEIGAEVTRRKLLDEGRCSPNGAQLWSPDGDRFACALPNPPDRTGTTLLVLDDTGTVLFRGTGVRDFVWSPSGAHLAYLTGQPGAANFMYHVLDKNNALVAEFPGGDEAVTFIGNPFHARPKVVWSPDGTALAYREPGGGIATYHVATRQLRPLMAEDGYPLAWVRGGQTLVVATQYSDCLRNCYKAILLDIVTGLRRPLATLDNSVDFWPSPDGDLAAFVYRQTDRTGEFVGIGVSILDFTTLTYNPITRSSISAPSEGIPPEHVAWTPDSSYVYWFHPGADWGPGGVYGVRQDGQGLSHVKDRGGQSFVHRVWFSPDIQKVAYIASDAPGTSPMLRIADLQSTDDREIGQSNAVSGWRPRGN